MAVGVDNGKEGVGVEVDSGHAVSRVNRNLAFGVL